jgi:hypothetical protein
VVVAYQPGEYQPNALDDVDGNNFQILANAIVYAAGQSSCECDDGDPCTQDTCAEAGCEFSAQPAATCDSTWERASLQVKEKVVGKEQLDVKLGKGPALTQIGWGNPLSSGGTVYAVCIYDDADVLVAHLDVDRAGDQCGVHDCWKALGGAPPAGKGYGYKDPNASSDGVHGMTLKSGPLGASKLGLKAKNAASKGQTQLPTGIAAALAGSTRATVQVHGSDLPQCFSATLDDVSSADPALFKARR